MGQRTKEILPGSPAPVDSPARTGFPGLSARARRIAATFVLVLDWWVESESPLPARDADRLFRGLVEPALPEVVR